MLAIAVNALYTTIRKRGTTRQLAGVIVTCVLSALLVLPALAWYNTRFATEQAVPPIAEIGVALAYVALWGWVVPFGVSIAYCLFAPQRTSSNSVYLPRHAKNRTTRGNAVAVGIVPPRRQPGVIAPFVYTEDTPWGWLEYRSGRFQGQRLALTRVVITMGREDDNDIWLDDDTASRYHAELAWCDGQTCLTDCDSLNGVLLNSRRIRGTMLIEADDLIEIGSCRFLFEPAEPPNTVNEKEDSLIRQAVWRGSLHSVLSQTPLPDVNPSVATPAYGNTLSESGSAQMRPAASESPPTRPLGQEIVTPAPAFANGNCLPMTQNLTSSPANGANGAAAGELQDAIGWEDTAVLQLELLLSEAAAPPSAFVICDGEMQDKSFLLDRPFLTIGRGTECDVVINDSSISRRHAQFLRQTNGDYVLDLSSRNGTKVNGELLQAPRLLQQGDVINVGNIRLEYTSVQEAHTTPLPPLAMPSLVRPGSGPVPLRLPSRPRE